MAKILVIAPHPDDEVLGCGGVMARHAAAGDEVHVAVVTRGIPEKWPSEQIETARGEMRRAHAELGGTQISFLDFPAPRLDTVAQHEVSDALGELFQRVRPEIMYIPHHGDMHFEHGLIHSSALVAARPVAGASVRRILSYETLSETDWAPPRPECAFVPNVFINITSHLNQKLRAMDCFESQVRQHPHPRSTENLKALAHLRGATAGFEAAEAFMLIRELV